MYFMTENVLAKREDENSFEHHKRLINGKMKDKTLAEYDYAELAPFIYGKQFTADETRKRMYGSAATLDILDESGIESMTENDLIKEIKSQRLELQKEKQQFYDQRREFNKLVSNEGRMDHLFEVLAESAKNLSESLGSITPKYIHAPIKPANSEMVLCLSDWHYGMVTNNIFNEYNTEICKERVGVVTRKTIERIELYKPKKLHILLLGDAISGAIHSTTRVASEELVCDQLMQVSEIIAQVIIILSNFVPEVEVHSTYGNHARTVQNKKDNMHGDNMEKILPWWLKQRIAAEAADSGEASNVVVNDNYDYEFIMFDSCGHTFCATHGDLDAVKTAPRQLSVLFSKVYNRDLEYVILADKHHHESFEELGVKAIICGSLCGTDEYANTKRLYSSPSQLLFVVTPSDGVDATYELKCEY